MPPSPDWVYLASNGILFAFAYSSTFEPFGAWIVKFGQPENASSPIVVTLSGIVMDVKERQSLNA